ncbi:MAG TPA: DUF2857 family protein [Thiotrichales bacterium]|nr:DUF2857 family protein [Thiotrichales bacterium]
MDRTNRTREARLNSALLRYAVECIADGDMASVRRMGFPPEMLSRLAEVRLQDLRRLETSKAIISRIEVNATALSRLLSHLDQERNREQDIRMLLQAGAPQAMMRALYGMSSSDYTAARRALGLSASAGRPREATEAEEQRLMRELARRSEQAESLSATDWIEIADRCGAPLRVLWPIIQGWRAPDGKEG